MAKAFKRNIKLTLETNGAKYHYTENRVTFNVSKDMDGAKPDTADISIFNLLETSMAIFQLEMENENSQLYVTLQTGYAGNLELLYSGEATRLMIFKSGSERVMRIVCGDSDRAINESVSMKAFAKGYSIKKMAKDLIDDLFDAGKVLIGEGVKAINEFTGTDFLKVPTIVSGNTNKALDELLKLKGKKHFIQDRTLKIIDINGYTKVIEQKLNADSGLLGSPMPGDKGGFNVKALLFPYFQQPGCKITIESEMVKGEFIIKRAKYVGDTHGSNWTAELYVE